MTAPRTALAWLLLLPWPGAAAAQGGAEERPSRPLSVHEAVARGLATHPQLGQARALERAADRGVAEAVAARIPRLALEGSAIRFAEPMVVAPLHAFDPTRPPSFARTLVQSRWMAHYTVFDGGARGAGIDGARAGLDGAGAAAAEAEMAVIEVVATAYLQALTAREIHAAQERRRVALDAELDRVTRTFEEGRAARVDVLRIDAEVARATAARLQSRQTLATSLAELARLVGLPAGAVHARDLVAPLPVALEPDTGLSERALAANPELRLARSEVVARRAALAGTRAEWLPDLWLSGGVATFGGSEGRFTGEWQVGLGITYPIFTGGARGHRIARATAEADAAGARERVVELAVRSRVDRALSDVTERAAQAEALRQAVAHLTEVVRIQRLALEAGAGVAADYLRAEADLIDTRAALARAEHERIGAHIALAHLTGALTTEWLARHLENQP